MLDIFLIEDPDVNSVGAKCEVEGGMQQSSAQRYHRRGRERERKEPDKSKIYQGRKYSHFVKPAGQGIVCHCATPPGRQSLITALPDSRSLLEHNVRY